MVQLKPKLKNSLGTIIIVEDNIFMAELLTEKVFGTGFEAIPVYDGATAIDKIFAEQFSLVLVDFSLPGDISGLELLKRVRSKYDKKTLPVVILLNTGD